MPKKLFLLDAYALVYRAHFVFIRNPRRTTTGMNTSAVYGFVNSLVEVIDKEKPDYLGVAFDVSAPTFRHEMYEAYKAQREETPEDIKLAVPIIKRLLEAMGIPCLEMAGYEADDVIGTIAWKAAEQGVATYMLTPDKDYAQLVKENVYMFRPKSKGGGHEVYDAETIKEKMGVRPDQVADFLGLKGDSVDNIPGVPKVGEKTAISLLEEFDSMENLLANIDKVTKKSIKKSLEEHREQAELSKTLAVIKIDVPLDLELDKLKFEPFDKTKVLPIFEELEFKGLAKRLFDEEISIGGEEQEMQAFDDVEADYVNADTPKKRQQLIDTLLKQDRFCFDTETTSLDAHTADLVGLAFSFEAKTGYYVPFPEEREEAGKLLEEFRPVWDCDAEKIAHNLKYDLLVLANYGVEVSGPFYDTMLAHYVLHAEGKHGMDVLARQYLNYDPVSIETLIGKKGKNQKSMRDVPVETVAKYAAEDADVTFQLRENFGAQLAKEKQLEQLLKTVDQPLLPVLVRMERNGINLDKDFLNTYSDELEKEIDALEKAAIKEANRQYRQLDDSEKEDEGMFGEQPLSFNIGSPKQLGEVLFDKLGIEGGKRTKSGQYKTDEKTLSKLAADGHQLPEIVLEYRGLRKLRSTYVEALPQLINEKTGLIHTSYNQTVAVTGRLSSNNPNLQNIPIRTPQGRKVRKAFIPRSKDYTLLAADYSQIELRIMAALSKDETMMTAFKNEDDIHTLTAARVFGVDPEDVTREHRSQAKMVNFGMIYGITPYGLAERLGIPNGEARDIHTNFFEQFPDIKAYMDHCVEQAKAEGYAETMLGRRHYLPDITSANRTVRGIAERNAINTPVQGTAADLIKLAMIKLHARMQAEKLQSKLLLQVHDELVLDAHKDELDHLKSIVEDCMTTAMELEGVPLVVEMGTGNNWLEAH